MWIDNQARYKPGQVVVKLRDDDGRFIKSIFVPSVMYPLNGPYEIFNCENTVKASEDMLAAVDRVEYKIGHCYSNTKAVVAELRKAGFDAVAYAGWLFVDRDETPIHHCWCVVNGNIVVDLCDDFAMQLTVQPNVRELSGEPLKEAFADFVAEAKTWPHSVRCYPIGTPWVTWVYVGSPCEPEEAVSIWRKLKKDFPNHECDRSVGGSSMTATQTYLAQKGLM